MKRKVGGCTAAFESEQFPHFTVNVPEPDLFSGNRGGVIAFFERAAFAYDHQEAIEALGCYVNGDCGFFVSPDNLADFLAWLRATTAMTFREVTDETL